MTPSDQARILVGVGRLLRFQTAGFQAFAPTPQEVYRSFLGMAWLIPLHLFLAVLEYQNQDKIDNVLPFFLVQALAYVLTWTLWPVLSWEISRALGLTQNWARYIAAYNWMRLPIYLIMTPLHALFLLRGLSEEGFVFLAALLLLASVAYMFMLLHHGLKTPVGSSILLVIIDLMAGMMLSYASVLVLQGSLPG
ncbi:MAG: hypothetical protein ACPGOY_10820 [Rhodospirillaceae bacterium]